MVGASSVYLSLVVTHLSISPCLPRSLQVPQSPSVSRTFLLSPSLFLAPVGYTNIADSNCIFRISLVSAAHQQESPILFSREHLLKLMNP